MIFTLRNLREQIVKREGKRTVEYAAALLRRVTFCLLFQHVCFFFCAVTAGATARSCSDPSAPGAQSSDCASCVL